MTQNVPHPAGAGALAGYIAEVSGILDRAAPLSEHVAQIAAAKKRLVTSGLVLPPELMRIHPTAPYTRNLIHHDPRDRFAVIAILWGPFQETAIHDHVNWCVVGVVQGDAHVTNYDRLDDGNTPGHAELRVRDSIMTHPGSVAALLPPPRSNIHKMANSSRATAVTIHTYGDPGTKATVFDVKAGRYETIQLKFHNLE